MLRYDKFHYVKLAKTKGRFWSCLVLLCCVRTIRRFRMFLCYCYCINSIFSLYLNQTFYLMNHMTCSGGGEAGSSGWGGEARGEARGEAGSKEGGEGERGHHGGI